MLLDKFDDWATLRPDALAIRCDGVALSYGELQARALCVARALSARGIGLGDRVAVYAPKNIGAVVTLLGISYAGAAYVPIDARAPNARVAQILRACSPRALFGHRPFLERLQASDKATLDGLEVWVADAHRGITDTDVNADANADVSADVNVNRIVGADTTGSSAARRNLPSRIPNTLPAYLLYTSGSTGQPKGVVVSHEAASAFVDWARRTFALVATDRLTNFAPLSFDLSILDLFGALSSGAAVDLVSPELLLRPAELVRNLAEWHTTTIYAVPSTISLLERDGNLASATVPSLRRVLYAGEPFGIAALVSAMRALPDCQFYNLFGPTETNVCTYYHVAEPPALSESQVPIGMGCDHLTVELLDESARPVPLGEEGELCVAGPSVMTEYFRDPAATLAAFHAGSLFADGRRRYRTGDRAVMDHLGRFWFHGRRDRLIKRRGYRIELGEIDAALQSHPEVRQAAAIAEQEGSETRIRAYVALENRGSLTSLILRAHCGSLLPPYMVPDSVEIVDELPHTLSGKLDLQLLRHRGLAS